MIKIVGSALLGVTLGAGLEAYVVSKPTAAAYQQIGESGSVSIDPFEMMKRSKDLPVTEIENPV
jgi:hypothetical protein